jgi:hypothetical protein
MLPALPLTALHLQQQTARQLAAQVMGMMGMRQRHHQNRSGKERRGAAEAAGASSEAAAAHEAAETTEHLRQQELLLPLCLLG